jgi:endonuclease/exonuclease/phosphatase family metal-dependent hydrolase
MKRRMSAEFVVLVVSTALLLFGACQHQQSVEHTDRQEDNDQADADDSNNTDVDPCESTVRIATFNLSLYRTEAGQLKNDLAAGDEQARLAADIIAKVNPDILLLNEFDYDQSGEALQLFNDQYLGATDAGSFEHAVPFASNTGVASGLDLNRDGQPVTDPSEEGFAGDAWGYGDFEGQYAFALLSRLPFAEDRVRTFQELRWSQLPTNHLPTDYYGEEIAAELRLSSKNHVDLHVEIGGRDLHLLLSHPTPPSFDGPEDRNGRRNLDEILFWKHYIESPNARWLCDDNEACGGLDPNEAFVIAGDLNSDPQDGDVVDGKSRRAAAELIASSQILADPTPSSTGAVEQARQQGGANESHTGPPAHDTADFADDRVGNLRVDYVLPSDELTVCGSGVFWPESTEEAFDLVGTFPFPVSDHRLVWIDIAEPIAQ